jgi:RNA polymerase sigma-70 factor (ECF subfamily)
MQQTQRIRLLEEGSKSNEARLREFLENRKSAPWGDIIRIFWRPIASAIVKTLRRYDDVDPDEVDELIQETYLRVCANDYRLLRETRADRPEQLFAFVQAIATTTTLDRYRNITTKRRGGDSTVIPIDSSVAEEGDSSNAERKLTRDLLLAQIDRQLQNYDRRDRQIFWLYYRQGFTAKDIAAIPAFGLSPKGVESAIHRLTSEIRRVFSGDFPPLKGEEV